MMNALQNVMNDESMRGRAMGLFRKAWEAFPQDRPNLLAYIHQPFRRLAGARDVRLRPRGPDPRRGLLLPLSAVERLRARSSPTDMPDGKVNSMVGHLLDMASGQGKLDELSRRIDDAMKRLPAWKAGLALKALIACRAARYDEADRLIQGLLKDDQQEQVSTNVYWIMANELENYATTRYSPAALRASALEGDQRPTRSRDGHQLRPERRRS